MATPSSGTSLQPSPAPSSTGSAETSPIPTPPNGAPEKAPDETSKLRTFLSILRRFIGVADIAAVRFSLPAQLLEPTPNLEYWGYLDRPETFISIPDSDEPLGRMLATLRFWFTKDLKYVKGKPVKPYNSVLGEFFRCSWEVEDSAPPVLQPASKSSRLSGESTSGKPVKVSYLTEQTSHHPPVSAFWIDCPEKGIIARGFDQLSAKFTGTSIRVIPGAHNLGIFISLRDRDDEQYQLTHPAAHLGGIIRGSLSVTVADTCYIVCAKTRIKVILQYMEEGWLGKAQNKVEGVIFNFDPDHDTKQRLKDVPDGDVLGRVEGVWTDKVYYTLGNGPFAKGEQHLLVDLSPLQAVPKIVPPESNQLPNESRRFWHNVTAAILSKQYSQATALKQELEERQRQKAAERKARGVEWRPRFFTEALTPVGKPELTSEGANVLKKMFEGHYELEESKETAV